MCYGCWIDAGKPDLINEKTLQAAKLIDEIYSNNDCGVGGYAHIVVDDWNMEDENIDFCIEAAQKGEYSHVGEKERQDCLNCLMFLKTLTEEERYSAMAIHDNFINQ